MSKNPWTTVQFDKLVTEDRPDEFIPTEFENITLIAQSEYPDDPQTNELCIVAGIIYQYSGSAWVALTTGSGGTVTWLEPVDDGVALAAIAGMSSGDCVLVKDDGDGKAAQYVYNGAAWVKMADIDWEPMSDAEVKSAYENNANTNAFTDSEKTKLGNIDDNADVTADNDPKGHNASHIDGTDDIALATNASKGLASATHITNLETHETALTSLGNLNTQLGVTLDESTDSRDPNNHAGNHTDGTDDIALATNASKGLASAAQITDLETHETALTSLSNLNTQLGVTLNTIETFTSSETLATGSEQSISHSLSGTPQIAWAMVSDDNGGTYTLVPGTHDGTNVKFTGTSGIKYIAFAIYLG